MTDDLHVESFVLGEWRTNCYVVWGERDESGDGGGKRPCWIVDAGFEPEPMLAFIDQHDLVPRQVVLTHGHVDHLAGLEEVRRRWPDLPILIHEAERRFPGEAALNLSVMLPRPIVAPDPTDTFAHGDTLALDRPTGGGAGKPFLFEVRHTPGHSPGGVCLYQPQAETAIVGDTLFADSIGRTDFPTSDHQTLLRSIKEQLLTLPDPTRVLPGHGPQTTIGRERRSNPYLQ